jgi:hypothetical protein
MKMHVSIAHGNKVFYWRIFPLLYRRNFEFGMFNVGLFDHGIIP